MNNNSNLSDAASIHDRMNLRMAVRPVSKRGWLPLAVGLVLLAGGAAACTVPEAETTKPAVTTAPAAAPVSGEPVPEAPVTTAPPAPIESKGFVLQSLNLDSDFTGAFDGTARIVDNEGGRTAMFTVTLFAGPTVVGTMTGMVNDSPAGVAQTVNFISSDKNVAYDRYEFQTDSAF